MPQGRIRNETRNTTHADEQCEKPREALVNNGSQTAQVLVDRESKVPESAVTVTI
jgi:hypothetical protein